METLLRDLKYGLRVLRGRPGLTVIAALALALGIGANTALFSILYAVMWKPLPYKDPERLAIVWETRVDTLQNVANPANYADWREQNSVFEDMAAFITTTANLTGEDRPEEVPIQYATPNLFSVLGVQPVIGRNFVSTDGVGDDNVVMLSYGLWMRRYGGDPAIAGKQILVNGRKVLVAGVMPRGFGWFIRPSITGKAPQLWAAFPITPELRVRRGRYLTTVARMKPGVTIQSAQANMNVVAGQLLAQNPDFNAGWGVNVVPLRQQLSGELRKPLWILAGAVAFVLLIACTNVANLMLARSISRTREMSIRTALGADRSRLIRQLLTESVLLAFLGGVAGVAIAVWGTDALALLGQRAGIDFESMKLNVPVLGFAFVISVATGLFFGIVPSILATKMNMQEQLKEGSRGTTDFRAGRLRNVLVAAQLAIAVVLLSGAALLIQSFWRLTSVNPGFDSGSVLSFRLLLPSAKYPKDENRIRLFRTVLERIGALPGVQSAGMVNYLPFAGPSAGTSFHIEGRPDPPAGQDRITNVFVVDEGFFRVLRIPLLQGRLFSRVETEQVKHVVLINQALARQFFPGEDPVGKRITIDMKDPNVPTEIIGIVGDVKNERLDTSAGPSVYWPHPELAYSFMSFVVRTDGDPLALAPAVTATIHEIDKDQPIADMRNLREWLGDSTAKAQFSMALLAVLAAIALILAVAGIYGVMSHAVVLRTREMGIRMALGAGSPDVFKLVLSEGSRILLSGAVIGCAAALALARLMKSMVFETSTSDPVLLAIVSCILLLSGLIACWIPSRRAARVSPLEALRYE